MSQVNQRALLWLIAGFTVWSIGFGVLYGLQALGCAYGWSNHRMWLIIAYGATLLPLAWLAMQRPNKAGEGETSLSKSALWANRAAFVAGVLTFLPVTFASLCQ